MPKNVRTRRLMTESASPSTDQRLWHRAPCKTLVMWKSSLDTAAFVHRLGPRASLSAGSIDDRESLRRQDERTITKNEGMAVRVNVYAAPSPACLFRPFDARLIRFAGHAARFPSDPSFKSMANSIASVPLTPSVLPFDMQSPAGVGWRASSSRPGRCCRGMFASAGHLTF